MGGSCARGCAGVGGPAWSGDATCRRGGRATGQRLRCSVIFRRWSSTRRGPRPSASARRPRVGLAVVAVRGAAWRSSTPSSSVRSLGCGHGRGYRRRPAGALPRRAAGHRCRLPVRSDVFVSVPVLAALTARQTRSGSPAVLRRACTAAHPLTQLASLALDRTVAVSRGSWSAGRPRCTTRPRCCAQPWRASAVSPRTGRRWGRRRGRGRARPGQSGGYAALLGWDQRVGRAGGRVVPGGRRCKLHKNRACSAGEADFADAIVRFWSGDRLAVAEVRKHAQVGGARPAGGSGRRTGSGAGPPAGFRFLARLFVAAGYEGWVLLFDEVELIGRYTSCSAVAPTPSCRVGWSANAEDPEPAGTVWRSRTTSMPPCSRAERPGRCPRSCGPGRSRNGTRSRGGRVRNARSSATCSASGTGRRRVDHAYEGSRALHSEAFG